MPPYGAQPYQAPGPAPGYGAYGAPYGAQPYAQPAYGQPQPGAQGGYGGYGGYGAPQDPYASQAQGGYGAYGGGQGGQSQAAPTTSAWTEMPDNEGRTYYYNTQTGVSQWEKPADMP